MNANHGKNSNTMQSQPRHHPGEIFGKFRLVSYLGTGGFGEVWQVEHIELPGKYEVIKFALRPEFHADLRREGIILNKLSHPGIVKITDMESSSSEPYVRMEYIPGETLAQILEQEGRLPWRQALTLILHIIEPLQVAHSHNIVHGDLKPANIFLNAGVVKIADFGLAVCQHGDENSAEFSGCLEPEPSPPAGTWRYMAPEQKQGDLRPASDIYALGMVLYRCVAGTFPSGLEPPSAYAQSCPEQVDNLVTRMLAPLQQRWSNLSELERETRRILTAPVLPLAPLLFFLGIVCIVFALGFFLRIPVALAVLVLIGIVLIEWARPQIADFWPLLLFWCGCGLMFVALWQRVFPLRIAIAIAVIGGLWFALRLAKTTPNESG